MVLQKNFADDADFWSCFTVKFNSIKDIDNFPHSSVEFGDLAGCGCFGSGRCGQFKGDVGTAFDDFSGQSMQVQPLQDVAEHNSHGQTLEAFEPQLEVSVTGKGSP